MPKEELKADELAFIDEYMISLNGVQAYLTVHSRSSYGAAKTNASRLLAKVTVKEEIKKRMEEHAMPANEALKRLTDMARASLFPFIKIEEDGRVYFNLADPEAKKHFHLIRKIKSKKHSHMVGKGDEQTDVTEQWIGVELHDALKALELLGKYHKLFTDKVERAERKVIRVTIRKSEE